jgi:hypothetical protein
MYKAIDSAIPLPENINGCREEFDWTPRCFLNKSFNYTRRTQGRWAAIMATVGRNDITLWRKSVVAALSASGAQS